jgi:hypothetical protein
LNGEVFEEGGVAISIAGDVALAGITSQGCAPIGETWTLTKVDGNIIRTIGNRPAYEVLAETFTQLSPDEQEEARQGNLHIGLVINEYLEEFHRGDFLIRNLLGWIRSRVQSPWELSAARANDSISAALIRRCQRGHERVVEEGEDRIERPAGVRSLLVQLQRTGTRPVQRAKPRCADGTIQVWANWVGRILLQRGDWAGGIEKLPARLHGVSSVAGQKGLTEAR